MRKSKKNDETKQAITQIALVLLAAIFLLSIFKFGFVLYRTSYADMTIDGWEKNCNLMLNKIQDSDSNNQKIMLVDLEGYSEDKIAYGQGKSTNNRCYELKSNPTVFRNRYIWLGIGIDSSKDDIIKNTLFTPLLVLLILLIILGIVAVFSKKPYDDEDDYDY